MTLTYVYCLVGSDRRPSVRRAPPGVAGSAGVQALDAGHGCWVVVSHVPATDYDEAALARHLGSLDWVGPRAMAHEAVVEHFLGARAVLPIPLMTLFTSDDRAVTHLTRNRKRLDRLLQRIDRQVEWGLRLTFDDRGADRQPRPPAANGRLARGGRAESGVDYLARKRDQLDGRSQRLTQARTEGNRLYRALAHEATGSVRRTATERAAPDSHLLVDAAFLVPRARTGAFRSVLRRHAKAAGESSVVVSLTGPWPPYHFVGRRPRGSDS